MQEKVKNDTNIENKYTYEYSEERFVKEDIISTPALTTTPTEFYPTTYPTIAFASMPTSTPVPTPKIESETQKALNLAIKSSGVPIDASVRAAIYFMDTGEEAYHREMEMKTPVSTLKVLFMLFFLEDVAEGKRDLSGIRVLKEEDKWTSSGKVAGTGIMKDVPNGTGYTWWEVIELMMIESDNVATNIIIIELGINNIRNRISAMGLKNTNFLGLFFDRKATVSSAKDMVKVLQELYERSTENEVYKRGLELMKIQRYRGRISRFIPELTVYHKTGQQSNCVADIGYVFYDDIKPPVLMAIFIDGTLSTSSDYAVYGDVIGSISRDMIHFIKDQS